MNTRNSHTLRNGTTHHLFQLLFRLRRRTYPVQIRRTEFSQSYTTRKAHTISSSHTYPPFTSPGESLAQTTQEQSLATSWVSVPSWLRMSRRSLGGSSGASNQQSAEAKAVTEVYSSGAHQSMASSQGAELGYSVLETPDSAIDPEMIEKFQALFAFDDKEKLFGCSCSST